MGILFILGGAMTKRTYTVTITNDAIGEKVREMYLAQSTGIELLFDYLEKGETIEFTGKIRRHTHLYGLISGLDVMELSNIKKVRV